jgi:hypothetical protein
MGSSASRMGKEISKMRKTKAKSPPRGEVTLLVRACAESIADCRKFDLYYDWAKHKHRNAQYLGLYAEKSVQLIGRIAKVVPCTVDVDANTVTVVAGHATLTQDERDRIIGATKAAQKRIEPTNPGWRLTRDHQFFLCDSLEESDFRKTSPGGLYGKRYFDLEDVLGCPVPNSISELARLLRQHEWK